VLCLLTLMCELYGSSVDSFPVARYELFPLLYIPTALEASCLLFLFRDNPLHHHHTTPCTHYHLIRPPPMASK
jgi:hypothetical protein